VVISTLIRPSECARRFPSPIAAIRKTSEDSDYNPCSCIDVGINPTHSPGAGTTIRVSARKSLAANRPMVLFLSMGLKRGSFGSGVG